MKEFEYQEELESLITKAVIKGWELDSSFGSKFYVQSLLNDVKLSTVSELYKSVKAKVESLSSQDGLLLEQTTESRKLQEAKDQLRLVQLIYNYRIFKEEQRREAAERRVERKEELSMLKKLKAEKKVEALGKKSAAALDKMIAELEKDEE